MTAVERVRARIRSDPGLALVVIAMLATAVLYAPTLTRGLVNLDDPWLVRDNWLVRGNSLRAVFFDFDVTHRFVLGAEYLPIRDLSVMLDWTVWGDWFGGHHLTNLALYLAAIPLWFGALVGFGVRREVAGLTVLLWAVMPCHAESVAWLAERKGVLAIAFAGACMFAYTKFRAGRSARWLAAAALFAICAVWSKALAAFAIAALVPLELVAPLALGVAVRTAGSDIATSGGASEVAALASVRRRALGLATIAVAAGAAFVPVVWTARAMAVVGPDLHAPAGRIAMAVGTFGFYTRLGLGSFANAVSYPIATDGPATIDLVIGALMLVACIAAIARSFVVARAAPERSRVWAIAAVIALVGWFPSSHLVLPLQQVVVADRYILFPTLGLALALAAAIIAIGRVRLRVALPAFLVAAFAMRAFDASASWADSTALWQRAVASNPSDGDAWSMYAEAVADRDAAAAIVATGLEHVRSPRLLLRASLLATDRVAARALLEEAARGGEPRAMTNLALSLSQDGDRTTALDWARRSVAASPAYANGYRILGKIALADGRNDEALAAFQQAMAFEPSNPNRFNLALALLALHRDAEARPLLDACAADPELAARVRAVLAAPRH